MVPRRHFLILSLMDKRALHWRHNDHDGVSNHQPHGCLLSRLFRRRSKKTSKLLVTGLCVGNSPGPVNSPHKGPVTRKMFPFDDVIMWKLYKLHHFFRKDCHVIWWHTLELLGRIISTISTRELWGFYRNIYSASAAYFSKIAGNKKIIHICDTALIEWAFVKYKTNDHYAS